MSERATGREESADGTPRNKPVTGGPGGHSDTRPAEPGSRAVAIVLLLGVLLFAMMVRGTRILVTAAHDPGAGAIQVATFLSSVLLAGLLLGGAAGAVVVRSFAGRDGTRLAGRRGRRALLAVLGGLVVGVAAGATAFLLTGDLHTAASLIIGVSIAVAALLGGAAAALRPGVMTVAGLIGTVVVIAVLAVRSLFITPLTRLFGGEGTIGAYAQAQSRLAMVSFIVAGLLAGIAAHLYVRHTGNRLRTAGNVAAGAAPGVLALVAQVLTWIGGGILINSAGGLDLGDKLAFQLAGSYQINGSLALLFAGALVAVLLYGRTRGPRRRRTPRTAAPKPDWAVREEQRAAELDRVERRAGSDDTAAADGPDTDDEAPVEPTPEATSTERP